MITLDRPLIVLDTETTSLIPQDARIVELAFILYTESFPSHVNREWRSIIDPGVPIPESASKVHGITDDKIKRCRVCDSLPDDQIHLTGESPNAEHPFHPWPRFILIAANLAQGFKDCDFAGKNVRFDLRVIAFEMERAGVSWSYGDARIIDADRLEQLGEPRTLSHLYEKHLGQKLEGAHGALIDARATAEVIAAQLKNYPMLPRTLIGLHRAQWSDRIDPDGRFKFVEGVPYVAFGKWNNKPMKDVPIDYWDWILSKDFSVDVKAVAAKAKLGQFPEAQ